MSDAEISLLEQEHSRQKQDQQPIMKKYKTLLLFIIASVSFILLVFYKHEYDRLKYTIEYLEIFGEPPKGKNGQPIQCSLAFVQRASTPPAEWTKVSSDISVYSTFWDEDNGLIQPKVRTVALVEKSSQKQAELQFKVHYETGDTLDAVCDMEPTEKRNHILGESNDFHVIYITCTPSAPAGKDFLLTRAPYSIQFGVGNERWSSSKLIQESSGFRTVEDKSALCVLPAEHFVQSVNIVEFISFYQVLGFNKFVFYGNVLTPTVRKLLDRFVDEMNIIVEEKSFNLIPSLQKLNADSMEKGQLDHIMKQAVELDCQYRHRATHENIFVAHSNEFLIPTLRESISSLLKSLSILGRTMKQVTEFHFSTQPVCVDTEHPKSSARGALLMGQQIHSAGSVKEAGAAILRPHLTTTSLSELTKAGIVKEQHISPASAVIYKFTECAKENLHEDLLHLPTKTDFLTLVETSLLYRKWKVNSG